MDHALTTSLDVAEGTTERERNSVSVVPPVREIADAYPAEHIYIGDEAADSAGEPRTVAKRVRVANPARGVATELTFFEEGFMRVRERSRNRTAKDHVLELRFLNMEPHVTRHLAMPALWAALAMAGLAALCWFVAPLTNIPHLVTPMAVVSGTAALVAFLFFVYRSEETFSFYTASGSAEVLSLRANLGCMRKCRALAPVISRAIRHAVAGTTLDDETYLRAEMQAHYRLRETGVITHKSCSEGVSLILSKFG